MSREGSEGSSTSVQETARDGGEAQYVSGNGARGVYRGVVALGRWLRSHSRTLSIILIASITVLLVWQLVRDWQTLPPRFLADVRYPSLLASVAVLIAVLPLVSLRWGLTLRAMDVPVGWKTSVRIWFLSQAGRYLPGGIWSYVGRLYLGQAEMAKGALATSMLLETGLRVISEVGAFILSLPFFVDTRFLSGEILLLMLAVTALGLILVHPAVLMRISQLAFLQRLGLEPVDLSRLRYGHVLGLLVYYSATVFLVGGAFYLLVSALYPVPLRLYPALAGSLAASVVLGFLVPLAPSGWGVREGVLAFLLSQMMPRSVAIVISVASRIWLTLGEVAWILAMVRLQRRVSLE